MRRERLRVAILAAGVLAWVGAAAVTWMTVGPVLALALWVWGLPATVVVGLLAVTSMGSPLRTRRARRAPIEPAEAPPVVAAPLALS